MFVTSDFFTSGLSVNPPTKLHTRGDMFVGVQEEQRIRAKQAKEDLEQFLLNNDKMNSSVKYWSACEHLFAVLD